jgi:integrase
MNIPKQSATLTQIVDFYLHSDVFRRLSSSSQKDYESHLQATVLTQVEGKTLGGYRCKNLKVRHIQQAYDNWLQVGVRTANYRRSVLSAAWRHAMRYDVMIHNPISLVQSVNEKPRKVHWSREQVSLFLDTAYSDFRWRSIGLIVHMAYDWGQRVGDVRLLTWDSLDLNKCRIDLTQSKRNAEVHLPISQGLCSMLRQQQEEFGFQEYVVPRVKPRAGAYTPYDKEEISLHINKILEEANLPKELTAMDLRRTAVTEMMEGGVDLAGIMQVTGHQNTASVKPYMVNTYSGASKALAARGDQDEDA